MVEGKRRHLFNYAILNYSSYTTTKPAFTLNIETFISYDLIFFEFNITFGTRDNEVEKNIR
jgi:hypothetical protein